MNPHAIITMEDGRQMELELYANKAPVTVENFVRLCNEHYYDNMIFHRIIQDYMIQGGSCTGSCDDGDVGFTIKGEFAENGVPTGIRHERGVISMARSHEYDSAAAQFFIMHQTAERLDGKFAAFGRLVGDESYKTLDKIAAVPTRPRAEENRPLTPQVIKSIAIVADTYSNAEEIFPSGR